MKKYRTAIVGCGRIASLFASDKKRKGVSTHAQAYLADPRVELRAACDLDADRLRAFGKQWKIERLYTNFNEMLRHEKIELLSVCTWNSSHAELVEKAVRAGVRGIICEKPLSDSLESGRKMIRLCERNGVPLLVNYTRRYIRLYYQIKKMTEKGELGRIQCVSGYYTAGLVNTATHLFDFLRFFFGDVDWVWTDPEISIGKDDKSISGYLHFKKGFGCAVAALDVDNYLIFEADIYGSKKRVRLRESGTKADVWSAAPHPFFSGYRFLKNAPSLSGDLGEGLPGLIDNLIRSVEGKEAPFCSGSDGLAALEIAAALRLSFERGGARVRLPLKTDMKLTSR